MNALLHKQKFVEANKKENLREISLKLNTCFRVLRYTTRLRYIPEIFDRQSADRAVYVGPRIRNI